MLLPSLATAAADAELPGITGVNARWLHKDGSHRWLERSAIVRHQEGLLLGYRGTDRDVTLRMQHGYDHSYFFMASFIADHIDWHARRLA